ncbi:hypothetical protein OH77DRAFT_1429584 [Trametes cingulata]|nr:hypothetical protein OH77DRAFT_1429584 [Trametes cingulata]
MSACSALSPLSCTTMEPSLAPSAPSSLPQNPVQLTINTAVAPSRRPAPTTTASGRAPHRTGSTASARAAVSASAPREGFWRKVKMLLGYAGRFERDRIRRRLFVHVITSVVFASAQIIVTAVLTAYGVSHTATAGAFDGLSEFAICKDLAIMNLIWLARTALACYISFWIYWTNHPRSDDAICPLDITGLRVLIRKFLPLATLMCFLIPIIFLAQRGRTCLDFAPHITALTLTILCAAFLRFTFSKAISLLCTSRVTRAPEKRHLTRAEVDRIPSVYYIPPPPDDSPASPISLPERTPSYPLGTPRAQRRKAHRFILFRPLARPSPAVGGGQQQQGNAGAPDGADAWEANWEPAELPYVRLEDNQATCSICRSDFEAPPRRAESLLPEGREAHELTSLPRRPPLSVQPSEIFEVRVRVESSQPADAPQGPRAGAGSGAPPRALRLLSCGHAFHKECIDPWLLGHATWCPNCKGAIEIASPPVSRWRSWRRQGTV